MELMVFSSGSFFNGKLESGPLLNDQNRATKYCKAVPKSWLGMKKLHYLRLMIIYLYNTFHRSYLKYA